MATSWIRMREDLADDPAIIEIADKLGTREEHVVGYCHKFWAWISRHSNGGTVTGVTLEALGRRLALPTFPELLLSVGWLEYEDSGPKPVISIPNFERYLSQGSKERALTAERQARFKSKKSNGSTVTEVTPSALPEKRREEKIRSTKEETAASATVSGQRQPAAVSSQQPSTGLVFPCDGTPKEWELPQAKLDEYQQSYPSLDVAGEIRSALQWIRDNPDRRKTARGMTRYLGNWLSKAQNSGRGRQPPANGNGNTNGQSSGEQFANFLKQRREQEANL